MAEKVTSAAKHKGRESECQSENDKRKHYTAFCKDANGNDLPTRHFVKQM